VTTSSPYKCFAEMCASQQSPNTF